MVSHWKRQKVDNIQQKPRDKDYADVLALLTNTSPEADSLLQRLHQTRRGIGFYMNANKIEFMGFKQKGAISTLSGKPKKSVDQFPYFGSKNSSTQSDINICLVKAIDHMKI